MATKEPRRPSPTRPSPPQPQTPAARGATPATGSASSARAGSAASVFVADPGPAFEAGQADDELAGGDARERSHLAAVPPPAAALVEEETVRGALTAKGELVHLLVGVGESDWRYTEADLRAIAPPLTRILNRYPAAAEAAASLGDPAAAGIGLFNYGLRSLQERRAVLAALEAEPDVPITGEPAPPGTGPPPASPAEGPGPETAGGGPTPPEGAQWTTGT